MPAKMTGAEWKLFYDDPEWWPKSGPNERFHDEALVTMNGEESDAVLDEAHSVPDDSVIRIESGIVMDVNNQEICELATYFRRWQKRQACEFLVIEAPKEKLADIKAAVKAAGGKVKS